MLPRSASSSLASGSLGTLVAASFVASFAHAQCTTQWVGTNTFGVEGSIATSTLWDPDGNGPLGPRLVVAGSITRAGVVPCSGIAAFDLSAQTWAALGALNGAVALAASPAGELYAAAGNNVSRWAGTAWQVLGSGMNGPVNAVAVQPNGDLLAGGAFTSAGGFAANGFARWTAGAWQSLGLGVPTVVDVLQPLPNGQVLGAATFTLGGAPLRYVARWNGISWTTLGDSVNGPVRALAVLPNGDYIASGAFTAFGSISTTRVARWNGSAWVAMASGLNDTVQALAALPNGILVAGGAFSHPSPGPDRIATWDGSAWRSFPASPSGDVATLAVLPDERIAAGGSFGQAGGVAVNNLARWTGVTWQALGLSWPGATTGQVKALATLSNGNLVVGQYGAWLTYIPIWGGSTWQSLGYVTNTFPASASVFSIAALPSGGCVVGGNFTRIQNSPIPSNVAIWNGTSLSPVPGIQGSTVRALTVDASGDIVAGGDFTSIGNHVALWNGTTWAPMGSGTPYPVHALATLPNGEVVAGGDFTSVFGNYVARWNGTTWLPMGSGMNARVLAVTALANGDIVAGGQFTAAGGSPASHIARWNGSTWLPIGSGMDDDVHA
ncbi:MAG: hypothetical protein FJX72_13755, partial [Armatimonadetes bacterium]|nr:hypothetical protein [Armatimonadota bacterium]